MSDANDELIELVMPWAKAHKPEAYRKTLEVAARPVAFRNYLLRLLELRCQGESGFLSTVPLRLLEETSLVVKVQHRPTGRVVEVAGAQVRPRQMGFSDLGREPDDFRALLDVIEAFDLERDA